MSLPAQMGLFNAPVLVDASRTSVSVSPTPTSQFALVFVDTPNGFIVYSNHQPVAWAVKGFTRGLETDSTKERSIYFVDVAFINRTKRTQFIDTAVIELLPNATHDYHLVYDLLLDQAKAFVTNTVKVGGAA